MARRAVVSPLAAVPALDEDSEIVRDAAQHLVQFYEDDAFLIDKVTEYLVAGLRAGECVLAAVTANHQRVLSLRLAAEGLDVERARRTQQLVLLDADETLASFMRDGMPDADAFATVVGAALDRSSTFDPQAQVRVYGEMVDVLCARENPAAAIALEGLWNDLIQCRSLSLLCAYSLDNFHSAAHGALFQHVCSAHSHVLPAESYADAAEPDDRLRQISELQQRARALEGEVAHRRQIEEALREAVRQRDEFLAVAGHELRTPLTSVNLLVQSLMGLPVLRALPEVQKRLERTARGVTRLARLIEDLLDASRMSAGRLTIHRDQVDLRDVVHEAIESSREALAAAGCSVALVAPGPVVGHWDRLRLEQAVGNLLANALKYAGGQQIDVRVDSVGDHAHLTVRDRGPGIAAADQARIFDRFERAVPSEHYGGLGLGLWIVQQVVAAHGGTIRLESEAGQGATFFLELPRQ
jgi:signal transduction histidine kinase